MGSVLLVVCIGAFLLVGCSENFVKSHQRVRRFSPLSSLPSFSGSGVSSYSSPPQSYSSSFRQPADSFIVHVPVSDRVLTSSAPAASSRDSGFFKQPPIDSGNSFGFGSARPSGPNRQAISKPPVESPRLPTGHASSPITSSGSLRQRPTSLSLKPPVGLHPHPGRHPHPPHRRPHPYSRRHQHPPRNDFLFMRAQGPVRANTGETCQTCRRRDPVNCRNYHPCVQSIWMLNDDCCAPLERAGTPSNAFTSPNNGFSSKRDNKWLTNTAADQAPIAQRPDAPVPMKVDQLFAGASDDRVKAALGLRENALSSSGLSSEERTAAVSYLDKLLGELTGGHSDSGGLPGFPSNTGFPVQSSEESVEDEEDR